MGVHLENLTANLLGLERELDEKRQQVRLLGICDESGLYLRVQHGIYNDGHNFLPLLNYLPHGTHIQISNGQVLMAKLQESLMESEERERGLESQVGQGQEPGFPGLWEQQVIFLSGLCKGAS